MNLNTSDLVGKKKTIRHFDINIPINTGKKNKKNISELINKNTKVMDAKVKDKFIRNKQQTEKCGVNIKSLVTVYSYMVTHADRLANVVRVNLSFKDVQKGRYLLFKSNILMDDGTAELYLKDYCNTLYVPECEPEMITVYKSGIIIASKSKKIYISKTNTFVLHLTNGVLKSATILKRCIGHIDTMRYTNIPIDQTITDIGMIKTLIESIMPKLYKSIKDIEDKKLIHQHVLMFIDDVIDINYLIKIYTLVLSKIDWK